MFNIWNNLNLNFYLVFVSQSILVFNMKTPFVCIQMYLRGLKWLPRLKEVQRCWNHAFPAKISNLDRLELGSNRLNLSESIHWSIQTPWIDRLIDPASFCSRELPFESIHGSIQELQSIHGSIGALIVAEIPFQSTSETPREFYKNPKIMKFRVDIV